ncbi:G-type lectin S-receptor-like serine/threonine-protein kinase At4g27290 [Cicer arietinum]|uniref:Receptor-like serine/threonine-protein kinase n=1 Tax=Cicer arietinum TaxID=3827 RepID=A0A1S2YU62_CICAR|nr:G-type lectin S-receptor-like serine/threonine-protein kinase At4g27290 [Cicer arietinum]
MIDNIIMLVFLFFLSSHIRTSTSVNSLAVNQSIRDGQTLVSSNGTFEVGFFSPGNSSSRYLGIWYRNLSPSTIVWVANRETPLRNKSGILKLNENGVLVVLNGTNNTVWSSKMSNKAVDSSIIAQLLDNGNFLLKIGQDDILWQSFDYPCDTLLPAMKLGWDNATGLNRFVTSWKSEDDPAKGEYSVKIDIRGCPQLVIMQRSVNKFRIGSWNGLGFTGYPIQQLKQKQRYKFVFNAKKVYHQYEVVDSSVVSIYMISSSGNLQALAWTSKQSGRIVIYTGGEDSCDNYAMCGANSVCNMDGNIPKCECLKGYVPKFPEQWNMSYWSNGCFPRIKSVCGDDNIGGFLKYTEMKLPDTSASLYNKTMNLVECQKSCLKNCLCTAYSNLDIRKGGSGCLQWFGDLVDMRKFSQWGQEFYIRLPSSVLAEIEPAAVNGNQNKKKIGIIVGVISFGFILCVCLIILRKRARIYHLAPFKWKQEFFRLTKEDMDLPIFEFSFIVKATNNFSSENKLGEGGFGPVYKGTLTDGKEVAVKRNSKMSDQGLDEFKNEVLLIAKLQHRNLVKLLGCCMEVEEKLLIYEYLPNRSLDYFIFDETRSKLLVWSQRSNIIAGIARGLLYLHQDSRLRIIHRDLKTSNILLDFHMNPKISDFGLARTFGGDQIEAKTTRMVGTYGYMPPEYAVHGHYSMKSDVFSFGVLILEIISGKKNKGFSDPEHSLNLLGHAWTLWTENRPLELIDKHLLETCISSEVFRCIHVGLLCVQQKPTDRPDMSSTILMLNGEKLLPHPKVPGFYTGRGLPEAVSTSSNQMSITTFAAR